MLRFIVAALWVVLFLIVSIPLFLIELVVGLFSKKARAKSSQAIISFGFKGVLFLAGTDITVKGLEKIPADEPVLFIPNHRSIFDIVILYPLLKKKQTAFVAKKELRKVPLFSSWMSLMNCKFLDRSNPKAGLKTILECVDLIKNGISIAIFPEGTRNKTDEPLLPFHDGSLHIAKKSGCTIVPVAINNTEKIFEAQMPKVRKAKVCMEFCDPIVTKDYSKEDFKALSEVIRGEIIKTAERNKALI
jgi:1-acyl-sn-glycerol-3-phosphate acyltransferase